MHSRIFEIGSAPIPLEERASLSDLPDWFFEASQIMGSIFLMPNAKASLIGSLADLMGTAIATVKRSPSSSRRKKITLRQSMRSF